MILYDGPFEIMDKISKVAYRLRMPASYGMHPVINITHLEPYLESPEEYGIRPKKSLSWEDFDQLPEFEVEKIIDEKFSRTRKGKRQRLFLTRFVGYGPEFDEWLSKSHLKNTPEVLREWEKERKFVKARVNLF